MSSQSPIKASPKASHRERHQIRALFLLAIGSVVAPIWLPFDYLQDFLLVVGILAVGGLIIAVVVRQHNLQRRRVDFRFAPEVVTPQLASIEPVVAVSSAPGQQKLQTDDDRVYPAAPRGSREIPGHPNVEYYHEGYHFSWLFHRLFAVVLIEVGAIFAISLTTGMIRLAAVLAMCLGLYGAECFRWKWVHWTREFNGLTDRATLYRPRSAWRMISSVGNPSIVMSQSEPDSQHGISRVYLRSSTLMIKTPTAELPWFNRLTHVLDAHRIRKVFLYAKNASGRREEKLVASADDQTKILKEILAELREIRNSQSASRPFVAPRVPDIGDTQEIPTQ